MVPGDGQPDDRQSQDDAEQASAIAAAEHILDGPTVQVSRSTLFALLGALRGSVRLLEDALAAADETGQGQGQGQGR